MHTVVWSTDRQAQMESHCNADCLIIQPETKGGHWESIEPCTSLPALDRQEVSSGLAICGQIKEGPVSGLHPWRVPGLLLVGGWWRWRKVVMVIAPGFNGCLDTWIWKILQPGRENHRTSEASKPDALTWSHIWDNHLFWEAFCTASE